MCLIRGCVLSRRGALAGLAAAVWGSGLVPPVAHSAVTENGLGPVFSPSGPDAERYGAAQGYPIADPARHRIFIA
jgi:hypothetical protein